MNLKIPRGKSLDETLSDVECWKTEVMFGCHYRTHT